MRLLNTILSDLEEPEACTQDCLSPLESLQKIYRLTKQLKVSSATQGQTIADLTQDLALKQKEKDQAERDKAMLRNEIEEREGKVAELQSQNAELASQIERANDTVLKLMQVVQRN